MNSNNLPAASASFPIVGIGASAGGLTLHSDGMLMALQQRHALIPVQRVVDQLQVEPDHVYVIPSGHGIS